MSAPIDPAVAEQAAQWFVRLGSGEATAEDIAQCAQWRSADAQHERAWQRAQEVSSRLGLLRADIALPTLLRPDPARRAFIKTLVVAMTAVPVGVLAVRTAPWRDWLADQRTAVGERRLTSLPDGTQVHLNTDTTMNVSFDAAQRLLALLDGEVLIDTAADPHRPPRPFLVQARHARLRALGTKFVVGQRRRRGWLAVHEGAVEIQSSTGAMRVIQAGWQAGFDAQGIGGEAPLDPNASAWTQGALVAERMRLDDFLDELSRHRPGLLRCDPQVADLRLSGVFQLHDTRQILHSLPQVLPVQVTWRTPYWVTVTGLQ